MTSSFTRREFLRTASAVVAGSQLVTSYAIHPNVSLQAGYSYMWGHAFFNHLSDDDTRFAYFQVTARY